MKSCIRLYIYHSFYILYSGYQENSSMVSVFFLLNKKKHTSAQTELHFGLHSWPLTLYKWFHKSLSLLSFSNMRRTRSHNQFVVLANAWKTLNFFGTYSRVFFVIKVHANLNFQVTLTKTFNCYKLYQQYILY